MGLINDIKAPTPPKNKRNGKIATVIGGLAEAIALTGTFDDRPIINAILHGVAVVFGAIAVNNAKATVDEPSK